MSLTVGVARVLDLTDARLQEHFGITLETLTGDGEDDLESCRTVADIARLEGYHAILSPSAALAVGRNLNLYIDGRADQSLRRAAGAGWTLICRGGRSARTCNANSDPAMSRGTWRLDIHRAEALGSLTKRIFVG
jgi:hypothetical protein